MLLLHSRPSNVNVEVLVQMLFYKRIASRQIVKKMNAAVILNQNFQLLVSNSLMYDSNTPISKTFLWISPHIEFVHKIFTEIKLFNYTIFFYWCIYWILLLVIIFEKWKSFQENVKIAEIYFVICVGIVL